MLMVVCAILTPPIPVQVNIHDMLQVKTHLPEAPEYLILSARVAPVFGWNLKLRHSKLESDLRVSFFGQ